jgi:hypothetical protein
MNNLYLFEDKTIGIYEHSIDLLRHKYVYDKIEYRDISGARIENRLPRNWIGQLTLGLVLLFSSLLIVLYVYKNSLPGDFLTNLLTFWSGSRGGGLIAVLFLFCFGIFVILNSLKRNISLTIETVSTSKTFDIQEINKKHLVDSLFEFLGERIENITIDKNFSAKNIDR